MKIMIMMNKDGSLDWIAQFPTSRGVWSSFRFPHLDPAGNCIMYDFLDIYIISIIMILVWNYCRWKSTFIERENVSDFPMIISGVITNLMMISMKVMTVAVVPMANEVVGTSSATLIPCVTSLLILISHKIKVYIVFKHFH